MARTPKGEPASPDILARVERIAELVEASAARNEQLGRLAPDVVDALHAERLFRLLLPRAIDGEEIDLPSWFHTMEALARLDGSTAWCVGQINGCAATAAAMDPAIAQRIWGEPQAALTWGPPVQARADAADGGHRVSGEWMMASGSRHATWIGLTATVYDRNGKPVPQHEGVTARTFYVPAREVEWIENWAVHGLTATNSGGYKVRDAFVPEGYSVCREALLDGAIERPLYKFPLNSFFATGFSGVALGIARAMLDAARALAVSKTPRAAKTGLRDNHGVQGAIGEAEARLRSARGYVEATAERVWREVVESGSLTTAHRIDIRMAATFAIHEAKAVADAAWEVAGASAIFDAGPFERRMRDITTVTQQLQGRKSHLQDTGAYLLGLEPNLMFA